MSSLIIIKEPSKELNQISREVTPEEINETLKTKLSDMATVMYANQGVGLAGPQIGDFRRILVADLKFVQSFNPNDYGVSLIKMINPLIVSSSKEKIVMMEGCLSTPDFEQRVDRSKSVTVSYMNEDGVPMETTFDGFSAIVIQHEIDHLNGVTLFTRAGKIAKKRYLTRVTNG